MTDPTIAAIDFLGATTMISTFALLFQSLVLVMVPLRLPEEWREKAIFGFVCAYVVLQNGFLVGAMLVLGPYCTEHPAHAYCQSVIL